MCDLSCVCFPFQAGTVSVSEFHQVLQEVTNFPLRPFVLPFLKANIPLLSREVAGLAVLSCQTPLQYLRAHHHLLVDLPSNTEHDLFHERSLKRRTSSGESVEEEDADNAYEAVKRPKLVPKAAEVAASALSGASTTRRQQQRVYPQPWAQQREPDINRVVAEYQQQQQQQQQQHGHGQQQQQQQQQHSQDDEWKNINVVCVSS